MGLDPLPRAGSPPHRGAVMKLLTLLLHFRSRTFSVPVELFGMIQSLSTREGISPCELVARLVSQADRLRRTADSVQGRWESLTPREQQVVFLVCEGYSNAEVGEKLGISPETVKIHLRRAMEKLELHNRYRLQEALEGFDFTPWME